MKYICLAIYIVLLWKLDIKPFIDTPEFQQHQPSMELDDLQSVVVLDISKCNGFYLAACFEKCFLCVA